MATTRVTLKGGQVIEVDFKNIGEVESFFAGSPPPVVDPRKCRNGHLRANNIDKHGRCVECKLARRTSPRPRFNAQVEPTKSVQPELPLGETLGARFFALEDGTVKIVDVVCAFEKAKALRVEVPWIPKRVELWVPKAWVLPGSDITEQGSSGCLILSRSRAVKVGLIRADDP